MTVNMRPTARIVVQSDATGRHVVVQVHWVPTDMRTIGVDRPYTFGISFARSEPELAERFAAAVDAGVAFTEPEIATDLIGRTYVNATCKVFGRTADADLRELGF